MSDKPLVQQALSSELAELVLIISTTSESLSFLKAFWEATVREWNGIDRLRSDGLRLASRPLTPDADWTNITCSFESLQTRHFDS
jgi:Nucleolar protein,Nop52